MTCVCVTKVDVISLPGTEQKAWYPAKRFKNSVFIMLNF
jgi:hypothetical protein